MRYLGFTSDDKDIVNIEYLKKYLGEYAGEQSSSPIVRENDIFVIGTEGKKIDSNYLPSYVDDVLEYASLSGFPAKGEAGKIYVATDTNLTYRWTGTQYLEISKSLALGETSSTAYAGNKGKANADAISVLQGYFNNGVAKNASLLDGHAVSYFATAQSVTDEAKARADADAVLQNNINKESQDRANAEKTLQDNINAEAKARSDADTTLQNNINSEAKAREEADTTLQDNINQEALDRENADSLLQGHIEEEAILREEADTALGNRIAVFERMFEWDGDDIKAKAGLFSDSFVSAGGKNNNAGGGGLYDRLDDWSIYDASKETWVLSAKLGKDLDSRVSQLRTDLNKLPITLDAYATIKWVEDKHYLQSFTETDPVFSASAAFGIKSSDINHWNSAVYSETDPIFTASAAHGITSGDISHWNSAVYKESDPVFMASAAANILSTDIAHWNSAVYTETDPVFTGSAAFGIKSSDIEHWNSAVYEEVDPVFSSSVASSITQNDINLWNKISALFDVDEHGDVKVLGGKGFYSDSFVSAGGKNEQGGGTGGYEMLQDWDSYEPSKAGYVVSAELLNALHINVESLENTSATKAELSTKVDKVSGMGLSHNDYSDTEKQRITNLESFKNRGEGFATSAQGSKADTAVQPAAISDMETKTHASQTYQAVTQKQNVITNSTTNYPSSKGVVDYVADHAVSKDGTGATGVWDITSKDIAEVESTIVDEQFSEKIISEKNEVMEVRELRGNTLVWNQKVNNIVEGAGVTITKNGDGSYTINGTATKRWAQMYAVGKGADYSLRSMIGHKIAIATVRISGDVTPVGNYPALCCGWVGDSSSVPLSGGGKVVTLDNQHDPSIGVTGTEGDVYNNLRVKFAVHDLTQMFGAGNEPSTYEEFLKLCPEARNATAYNEGQLVNFTADAIASKGGINLWDEEIREGGYGTSTGEYYSASTSSCNVNPLMVLPNTTYHYKKDISSGGFYFYEYDENMNFIRFIDGSGIGGNLTTSANARYLNFRWGTRDESVLKGICINLSDPTINGKYFPSESGKRKIAVTELRSKTGELIFPDGMKKAGTVCDEIVGRKAIKRMGVKVFDGTESDIIGGGSVGVFYIARQSLQNVLPGCAVIPHVISANYLAFHTLNNVDDSTEDKIIVGYVYGDYYQPIVIKDTRYTSLAAWKSHLAELYAAGKPLVVIYELATPIEYELPDDIQIELPALQGSTISLETKNDTDGAISTAPLNATIAYRKNIKKSVRDILGSMDNWYMRTYGDQTIYGEKTFGNDVKIDGKLKGILKIASDPERPNDIAEFSSDGFKCVGGEILGGDVENGMFTFSAKIPVIQSAPEINRILLVGLDTIELGIDGGDKPTLLMRYGNLNIADGNFDVNGTLKAKSVDDSMIVSNTDIDNMINEIFA